MAKYSPGAEPPKIKKRLPRALQQVKDIVDNNPDLKCSIADGTTEFIYEETCPFCGKARIVHSHNIDFNLHKTSIWEGPPVVLQNIQEVFDKYALGVQLTPSMEIEHINHDDTCKCQLTEKCEKLFNHSHSESTKESHYMLDGRISIVAEVVGTMYEGRSERIDNLDDDEILILKRPPQNVFNRNNIEVCNKFGESLGNLNGDLCNILAPFVDAKEIILTNISIVCRKRRSERSALARKSTLDVSFFIEPTDCKFPQKWINRMYLSQLENHAFLNLIEETAADDVYSFRSYTNHFAVGECIRMAKSLQPKTALAIQVEGSLETGGFVCQVCTLQGKQIGCLHFEDTPMIGQLWNAGYFLELSAVVSEEQTMHWGDSDSIYHLEIDIIFRTKKGLLQPKAWL